MRHRLVFVTQLIDPDDPVLGFVVPQIRELARCLDVVVIANEVRGRQRVPIDAELFSLGKEHSRGRVGRAVEFLTTLGTTVHRSRPSALLGHMCPSYVTAAAPAMRPLRIPELLWFVHPEDSRSLRTAERCADLVLTALPGSYPRRGGKVRAIGHAIDTESIRPAPLATRDHEPLQLLAMGRTSPVKHYDTIVAAVANARAQGADARLRIVGPSVTEDERRHRRDLLALASRQEPGVVEIRDSVPRDEVARELGWADALVNATAAGSADKVVFEAMARGRPVLASSPAFATLLDPQPVPLRFPEGDVDALGQRIATLAAIRRRELAAVGDRLRADVVANHSLRHWAEQVSATVDEVVSRSRRRTR